MATDGLHNLVVHWGFTEERIRRIDPYNCSYLDLLDKVCDVCLGAPHDNSGFIVSLFHGVEGMKDKVALTNDLDLKNMFATHENICEIHIFATFKPMPPVIAEKHNFQVTKVSNVHLKNESNVGEKVEFDEKKGGVMSHKRKGMNVDAGSEKNQDDNLRENVDFSKIDREGKTYKETDVSHDSSFEVNSVDDIEGEVNMGNMNDSTDNMYDYSFEDSLFDFMSMSDIEVDGGCNDQGTMGRKFMRGEDGKIMLEKGMWFMDVNEFKEALSDFSIQEGFELIWEKNEETRVIAHCAQADCTWSVPASATPDGKIYIIEGYNLIHNCASATLHGTQFRRRKRQRICIRPKEDNKDIHSQAFNVNNKTKETLRKKKAKRDEVRGGIKISRVKLESDNVSTQGTTNMNTRLEYASAMIFLHESSTSTSPPQTTSGPEGSNSSSSGDVGEPGDCSNVGTNI